MDVLLPNGQLIQDVPEGTTKAMLVAKLKAKGYDTSWYQEPAPAERTPPPNVPELTIPERIATGVGSTIDVMRPFGMNMQELADVAVGASGTMRGGLNLISDGLGDKAFPKSAGSGSWLETAGAFLDPVAMAIASATGGIVNPLTAKALAKAPALAKAAPAITRAVEGGVAGGVIGGLSDEGSAASGAAVGATASVVLPHILQAAAKGAGWAVDALKGRLSDIRAGKVARDVAGEELPQILAALDKSAQGVTAAQAAVRGGVDSTTFSALGKRAADNDSNYVNRLLEQQSQGRADAVAALSGGSTKTEANAAAKAAKDALNARMTPVRETALNNANNMSGFIIDTQQSAAENAARAADQVDKVRRAAAGAEQAQRLADATQPIPGQPRVPPRYTYMGEVASPGGIADRVMTASAAASLAAGDSARNAQLVLSTLKRWGLKPLTADSINRHIDAAIKDPSLSAGNKTLRRVLQNVAKETKAWTDNSGVIDAEALYNIRKNAVSAEVERLAGSQSKSSKSNLTASVLAKINPIIDDAIERAGGVGWKTYLTEYREGMKVIERMNLGSMAQVELKKNPAKFIDLVRGESPKDIKKLFTVTDDIRAAAGKDYPVYDNIAQELEHDRTLANLATAGSTDVNNILKRAAAKGLRLPNFINWKLAALNKTADLVEGTLDYKTMSKVYHAMRNGKDAAALLRTLSTYEQNAVLRAARIKQFSPSIAAVFVAAEEGAK